MVNYDEAYASSLEYFHGNELAARVFVGKYALQDLKGDYLESNPDQMIDRVANELHRIEQNYPNPIGLKKIKAYLEDFAQIIPQGSPLFGIGNKLQTVSLGNCFVIESPHDSYGGIMKTDQELAQLMKRRGGVGVDISTLRPEGEIVRNSAKTTSGIAGFMERFSNTCREVGQKGRRGAEIITLNVHHPEIETFINIKKDLTKVTGANISVKFTDEFMNAVRNNETYEQRFPVELKAGEMPKISRQVDATKIYKMFCQAAWQSAEPGVLYWDRANKYSPAHNYGKIDAKFYNAACNPCGEIIMSAFDSCRLMLINLNHYVKDKFLSSAYFDFVAFKKASYDAQKLMDDTIDLEIEKMHAILKKIDLDPEPDNVKYAEKTMWESFLDTTIKGRRTGLGITGLGDALAALNIQYGGKDSVKMSEDIYRTLCLGSYESSIDMAEQRGAFPLFNLEIDKDNGFMENLLPQLSPEYLAKYEKYGRRNIAALTTAPAGSVSLMALFAEDINGKYFGVTSGIEPVFKTEHIRRKKINPNDKDAQVDFVDDLGDKWQEFPVYHTAYKYWKDMHLCGATNMPNPYINASSEDIDWNTSVLLQSKAQKWIDHSISKTCNLPNSATVELVSQVYMTAWESGCKGFTVYRDGSRSGVLISATPTNENKEIFNETTAPKRPASLKCEVHYSNIDKSKWIILVGMLNGKPYEVFGGIIDEEKTVISKSIKEAELVKNAKGNYDLVKDEAILVSNVLETLNNSSYNFHTRTLSMALRHGAPVQYIVEQLQKIGDKEIGLYSFNKVIARVLKKYIPDGTIRKGASCPSCGSLNVAYQEGCLSCKDCGYSKCG